MKKSKIKQKVALALVAFTLVTGVVATNAKAINNSDTNWSFSTFGNKDEGQTMTDPREKTDTSPAYSKVEHYYGKSGDYLQMFVVDADGNDFNTRIVKTVTGSGQYSISSYAYEERGKADVRLRFYAPWRAFYSWSASGVWSPDSLGRYN